MGRFALFTDASVKADAVHVGRLPAVLRRELESELPTPKSTAEQTRRDMEVERMVRRMLRSDRVPQAVKLQILQAMGRTP